MGNYRLLRTIGKGNFAKVKLARHILTGREVSGGGRGAEVGGRGRAEIKRQDVTRGQGWPWLALLPQKIARLAQNVKVAWF